MSEENLRFKREILGVSAILGLFSLYILYPFLDAIILALATSYLLKFAHNNLDKKIKNEFISSTLIIAGVLGSLSFGLYMFLAHFVEIISVLNSLTGSIRQGVLNFIEFFSLSPEFEQNLLNIVDTLSNQLTGWLINSFTSIPSLIIDLGIFLFTAIYLYRDGPRLNSELNRTIESLPNDEERIIRSLIESIDSIFKGVFVTQFAVAFIIGVATAIGFYLISIIASPISLIPVWSVLIAIAALLPIVAGFMLYAPLGAYYIFLGEPLTGMLILIYGVLVINVLPEIFFRPYIGSKRLDEHPLIIFIGFLAGPLTLGLKGIVLGPVILILTKQFILNYADLVSSSNP